MLSLGGALIARAPSMVSNSYPTIHLSGYLALTPASAVAIGQLFTTLRCAVAGGRHGGNRELLKAEWRCFGLIALLDLVGGAAIAASLWLLSPVRSTTLLQLNHEHPVAFWAAMGALGPTAISGLLRWTPPKVRIHSEWMGAGRGDDLVQIATYRRELTTYLYSIAEQSAESWLGQRDDWLILIVTRRANDGSITPGLLDREVRRVADSGRSGALPDGWENFTYEASFTSADPLVRRDLVIRMASSALDSGLAYTVATCCRVKITSFNRLDLSSLNSGVIGPQSLEDEIDAELRSLDSFEATLESKPPPGA